jgi:hypothetical protein
MTSTTRQARRGRAPASGRGLRPPAPRWFLTGPASAEDLTSSAPRIAGLSTHAKMMGTNTTACGLPTTAWTKLWSVAFESSPTATRCPRCVSRVYGV